MSSHNTYSFWKFGTHGQKQAKCRQWAYTQVGPPSLNDFYVYTDSNRDRLCIPLTVHALSHRLKSLNFYFGGNIGLSFLSLFFVYSDSTLELSFMKIIQLKWHRLFVIILLSVFGFPWTHKLFLSLLCSGYFRHRFSSVPIPHPSRVLVFWPYHPADLYGKG